MQTATLTFMVCVEGGCLDPADEALDEVSALARAKELKAEHPDWLVTLVLNAE